MDSLLRLLLRFIVVPFGYLAAVLAGACVILFGSWQFGAALLSENPDKFSYGVFGTVLAGPILFVMLAAIMWLPGAIGILISEAFAIRSWIFHALNGAASAWLGWQMFTMFDKGNAAPLNEPRFVIAAGLAGGFAYWAVAGWNAGFWKPVFRQHTLPQLPPPADPFNPPAQTKA
jgi:hypothetical protein